MSNQKPILFFDGVCHLCNTFVDEVIQRDHQSRLQFAPLQGETAKGLLEPAEITTLASVILLVDSKKYVASAAILRVLLILGGWYRLFALFLLIPSGLRDWIYQQIAKRRYLWFGVRNQCRLPLPHEKDRLLP